MYSPKHVGQIHCPLWASQKILTDQGHNFESDLLKELCDLAQVKKIRTSGYHPQTNGQCECFNATLINMLGTLPGKNQKVHGENRSQHWYMLTIVQEIMQLISVGITSCLAENHVYQLTYILVQIQLICKVTPVLSMLKILN